MRRRAIIGVLLLAIAGCGGGDQKEPAGARDAPKPPGKQLFMAKADRLCAWAQRRSRLIGQGQPRSPQGLVRKARQISQLVRDSKRRLDRIDVPAGGRARREARRFVASVRALSHPGRLIGRSANQLERAVAGHSSEAAHTAILKLVQGLVELQRVDAASTRLAKR